MAEMPEDIISLKEFDARGRTVDGRFQFLGSTVQQWVMQGKVTDAPLLIGWSGELSRWNVWFQENIVNRDFFTMFKPHVIDELDAFDKSVTEWRAKLEAAAKAKVAGAEWQPVQPPGTFDKTVEGVTGAVGALTTLIVVGVGGFLLVTFAKGYSR